MEELKQRYLKYSENVKANNQYNPPTINSESQYIFYIIYKK